MERTPKLKRILIIIAIALVAIAVFGVFRGPHISNALKRLILPELEAASGRRVIAQKIYINLFPLFVEAKGIKIFDEKGERIVAVKRAKAYVDLSRIFSKTIAIRRLVLKEVLVSTNESEAKEIAENIRTYLAKERPDALKVTVISIELQESAVGYAAPSAGLAVDAQDISAEVVLKEKARVTLEVGTAGVRAEGWPELTMGLSAQIEADTNEIRLNRFGLRIAESLLSGSGAYKNEAAEIRTEGNLLVRTFKKIFGLRSPGEGELALRGGINIAKGHVSVDLAVSGAFYLQLLMEILKVKEPIEGRTVFSGRIEGPLEDLKGEGKAELTLGSLYGVAIDRVKCRIVYADGLMSFSEGEGILYGGRAKAAASITLPTVDRFTVDVEATDVDSKPLFGLIGWDPGIAPGKVTGTLHTAGAEFNPAGRFHLRSTAEGADMLGRVKEVAGEYWLNGNELGLDALRVRTERSEITASGSVNLGKKTLNLSAGLTSSDVGDLTKPYYAGVQAGGSFSGTVTGAFDDPVLEGEVSLVKPVIEGYPLEELKANVLYRKRLLKVHTLTAAANGEEHRLSGEIAFPKAKELFDLGSAQYSIKGIIRNAEMGRVVRVFYPEFRGAGGLQAEISIAGSAENPDLRGSGEISRASVYDVPLDSASVKMRVLGRKIDFTDIRARRGASSVAGDLTIFPDGTFRYRARTERLLLSDLIQRKLIGEVAMSAESDGQGAFDNPEITFRGRILEGTLKGKPIGSGDFSGSLQDRRYTVAAALLGERIRLRGEGRIDGERPWQATVSMAGGRYDILLTSVLKDAPDDLIVNLRGEVRLRGDRNHIEGAADVSNVVISMYGYSFSGEENIRLALRDRYLNLNTISLRSGTTIVRTTGSLVIGKEFDLTVEGSSSLAPFKSLSSRLSVLRGDAEFVLSVNGPWDAPRINGGLTLENGVIGVKDYPYRVSALSGYLYMDNDRVVLQRLTGKVGGGDVDFSGVLYLKRFAFKRFYVEAKLANITATPSDDFTVNFGGNILYKGTPTSQIISGDVVINRARYRKRVEWKSWLLQMKRSEPYKSEISNVEKAELNIKISGERSILIDNNVARATGSADMLLRGTVYRPVLFGRLEAKEGTVFFRNNEFRIIRVSADFSDPERMHPFIEIAAETIVKSYKIKMNLEGQLDRFQMSLASDPPLKEMDILALLTVGQKGAELKGLEGGVGAGEATSFVTGKLQDVIEERLKSITGLDRFQIDPHVSKTTGTVEPRVTASKRLLGDKVFVTYTTGVGSTEEQIIRLEYYLSKNVSLIGVRDERGITGGDVRFRFEFK